MTATATPPASAPTGSTRRVKVPTVLQMQVTECGAASLAMILAHYGRWVPLEELRERCGASRDGTSAADLLKAARHYGLDGHGSYLRAGRLVEKGYPLILFWKGAHFLVLEGIDEDGAWLNDPAVGHRRVTRDELEDDYTKICLTLRPTAEFRPGGGRPRPWLAVLSRARRVIAEVVAVVLVGLLATVPGIAVAVVSKLFVDDVLVAGDQDAAWPLVGGLALVIALQALLMWFQQRVLVRVAVGLTVAESARFVHRALRLPEQYFVARSVPDLAQRVQHNRDVVGLLTGRLASVLIGTVMVAVYGVAMVLVDPLLAAVAIVLTLVNLFAVRSALKRRQAPSRVLVQQQAQLQSTTAYGAMTLETIKAGGLESDYYARWEGLAVRVADVRQDIALRTQVGNAVPTLLKALTSALVLGIGAWLVIEGRLAVGSLVAFQTLMASFSGPITDLVGFAWMFQSVQNMVRRLDDVLEEAPDPGSDPAVQRMTMDDGPLRLRGTVELRDVTFGYKRTVAPLVEGFDLMVPPGARVAVVGTSGSGKSTLVKLISGLYEPWTGAVLLDGRHRHDVPRPVLARSVAMVDQRIALFSGTVRENLTLWDPTVADDDVVRAAMDAQIHDAIVARAGGYAAVVAEGGGNWSGGQRQRLEIARALVRNPSVLVLDEATSALDSETEAAVEAGLRRRGCTTIVVAHRLSTVRDADLILVMEQGKVVERGRHDELLALDGAYARLVEQ